MTWWSPLKVLEFAREAGFDNDSAHKAATVALVTSSGADHHSWETPGVEQSGQNGLWGIPEGLVEEVSGGDQFDPRSSAATALALYLRYGRKWNWHPVVRSDGGALCARTLDALNLDRLWVAKPAVMFASLDHLRDLTYTSARIKKVLSMHPISPNER
jgi:hypothetical protein